MALPFPDRLIVCPPYAEPDCHWAYAAGPAPWTLVPERRPAGYVEATPGSRDPYDPGVFHPLPLVNQIRERVRAWRSEHYPGATAVTKRLLDHWHTADARPDRRLFYCQLEAIETLIWLQEAPPAARTGVVVPTDGGPFVRLCAKMATGTGKTTVMAMLIAWQVLNRSGRQNAANYSRNVLVVAPNLTVRRRLAVLVPGSDGNAFEEFDLIPPGLEDRLRQGATCHVRVVNCQQLAWETAAQLRRRHSVDKRGPVSDARYARDVLGDMAGATNLLVVNDEAHHAWRLGPGRRPAGVDRDEVQTATRWVAGLDRLSRVCGIRTCYDFSATPFVPGGSSGVDRLFEWVVSDFGLEDAIESGLVKTPRVVVRDDAVPDARSYRSRLFHIYADPEVHDDVNRQAPETAPLPSLVVNAYALLAADWAATRQAWADHPVPPAMITVANRTETAARVRRAVEEGEIGVPELALPGATLHIDSKVLQEAEAVEDLASDDRPAAGDDASGAVAPATPSQSAGRARTRAERAAYLREQVNTVGRPGGAGAAVRHVISVGMLSEGWDARTVTHILGLRAFTSQLLCEQVVGRGLRRTSYDVDPVSGLLRPEYVNVFGVPFRFLPHEGEGKPPPPERPLVRVEPLPARQALAISFPNVVRVERTLRNTLTLDLGRVEPLVLDAENAVLHAELAPALEGKTHVLDWAQLDLEGFLADRRLQTLAFETARRVFSQMRPGWSGAPGLLIAQVTALVDRFMRSPALVIRPAGWADDGLRRRALLALGMQKIVNHVWSAIGQQSAERLEPILDDQRPVRSTSELRPWYTGRPCAPTTRSHVNVCVLDSTWEASEAYALDHHPLVSCWVKNDHLGLEIPYLHQGVVRTYRPDFLVRLTSGRVLVLEVKGQDSDEAGAKHQALAEWVRAVNGTGALGSFVWAVSRHPRDVDDLIMAAHARDTD